MLTTNRMPELMDDHSRKLFVVSLIVEPAEIHGWGRLGDGERAGSDYRPGSACEMMLVFWPSS